ncbi:MAG: cell division protein FtsZ [Chitinophagaceae bacterium]|nr:cell division protein FtsZ [Chitinophagaceae bacterium]
MILFDLPKEQSSILKVIGVGGGGGNAVNHMYAQNIDGVDFIICNTDAQAIAQSKVPNKVQLGPHLTQGLGAGANPAIGREATQESLDEIKRILEVNTKMAFITAGMGGGTGTGGAPILAKVCKDLGILTVGIVTTPFAYEGKKRIIQAEEGIRQLKDHVDTLLVISNDKLRHQFGNLKMKEAFAKADNVLATAAKCITDVINSTGQINVDFADVCTVMKNGGVAILGSAAAAGENRAQEAIEQALASPLLNDNDIQGARWILININSAEGDHEFTMDEVEIIQQYLLSHAGEDTDVILGLGYDNSLEDKIGITLIATGFDHKDPFPKESKPATKNKEEEKIVMQLSMPEANNPAKPVAETNEKIVDEAAIEQVENETLMETKKVEILKLDFADEDPYMPKLKEETTVDLPGKNTVDKNEDTESSEPLFFEISSASDQIPIVEFDFENPNPNPLTKPATAPQDNGAEAPDKKKENFNDASSTAKPLSSGAFLAKPKQIYAEELPNADVELSKPNEEPLPKQIEPAEDETAMFEMQLVVKDSNNAAEEEPIVQQTQPIMKSEVEEPAMQDETEELRRRAMERIAKLRNLSFNINAADPNNEFESVPAYLRRNMELHNQIADVESFYSNVTVKTDDKNQAELSTINTFLEGKKPD